MDSLHTFEDPVLQHSSYQLDINNINLSVKRILQEIKAFCENNGYSDTIEDIKPDEEIGVGFVNWIALDIEAFAEKYNLPLPVHA